MSKIYKYVSTKYLTQVTKFNCFSRTTSVIRKHKKLPYSQKFVQSLNVAFNPHATITRRRIVCAKIRVFAHDVRRGIRRECGKQLHLASTESLVKTMPFLTRLCTAHLRGQVELAAFRFIFERCLYLAKPSELRRDSIMLFTAARFLCIGETFCDIELLVSPTIFVAVPLSFECRALISSEHRRQIEITNCDNERICENCEKQRLRPLEA